MAAPVDFVPIRLHCMHRLDAIERAVALAMSAARRGEVSDPDRAWPGFAAELALADAVNEAGDLFAAPAETLAYDLDLFHEKHGETSVAVEVKTRIMRNGWTNPECFDFFVIPTHSGREPVKEAADLVVFCWYSFDEPRRLHVLGYLRGVEEFKRRATFYSEGDPLPPGGWAKTGGAYVLEPKQLRPMPAKTLADADMIRETF